MSSLMRPTIPVRYIAEMAARSSVDQSAIARALVGAALPEDALELPRFRVSVVQLERFYALLRRAADDELFGYFERKVPPGAYATLVRMLTACVDVRAALDAAARFYRLFDRHEYWRLDIGARMTTLRLAPRDDDQRRSIFFTHSMLISPWLTSAWLSGRSVALEAIRLPRRFRAFASETRYLFGREPIFDAGPPSLTVPSELLRRRVARGAVDADAYLRTSLRAHVLGPGPTTFEGELRALFFEADPVGDLSLAEAARRLRLSRTSLARRLARHALSFQAIKDEVRRDHAIALLTQTSQSIAEIAERVGYSAPSALQRAFRDWTGVPPGRFRRS